MMENKMAMEVAMMAMAMSNAQGESGRSWDSWEGLYLESMSLVPNKLYIYSFWLGCKCVDDANPYSLRRVVLSYIFFHLKGVCKKNFKNHTKN